MPAPPSLRFLAPRYLAHHLYGLAPDHKKLLAEQLNDQLALLRRTRRGVPGTPGAGSVPWPEGRVAVPKGVGWGQGGGAATALIVGRLKVCPRPSQQPHLTTPAETANGHWSPANDACHRGGPYMSQAWLFGPLL